MAHRRGGSYAIRVRIWPPVLAAAAAGFRYLTVPLYTAEGETRFAIAGVYYDYNAQGGAVMMDLQTLIAHWGAAGINGLALYLEPDRHASTIED